MDSLLEQVDRSLRLRLPLILTLLLPLSLSLESENQTDSPEPSLAPLPEYPEHLKTLRAISYTEGVVPLLWRC